MERKDFIRKGLMGTGAFVASAAFGNVLKNDIDELKELAPVGFNHLPNRPAPLTPAQYYIRRIPADMPTMAGSTVIIPLVSPTTTTLTGCTSAHCGY